MKAPVIIVGLGELGGEFGKGFLRCGHPVIPVLRGMNMDSLAMENPSPGLVLVAVAENDLSPVLAELPVSWRRCTALIQNELIPTAWQRRGLEEPTVAVVWFEKKPGGPLNDILDTPVYGPKAVLLGKALRKMGVKIRLLSSENELIFELARKSLYILTLNIASLEVDATAGELWREHWDLVAAVMTEVLQVLEKRFATCLPKDALVTGVAAGVADCPHRRARGRRARQRLQGVVAEAGKSGLAVPTLEKIEQQILRHGIT